MRKLLTIVVLSISVMSAEISLAAQSLSYPGDCKDNTLKAAAKKNGCVLTDGGRHWKVTKDDITVTVIPYSVKENDTCRAIIKALNSQC